MRVGIAAVHGGFAFGKVVGSALAWDFIEAFLGTHFSGADRHLRRLAKVKTLENHQGGS
jgi:ribose 5-phosphate isomerase B